MAPEARAATAGTMTPGLQEGAADEEAEAVEAPAEQPSGMAAVRAALAALGFVQYADAFDEQGYDDLEWLKGLPFERLVAVGLKVGMRPGHADRFADQLSV